MEKYYRTNIDFETGQKIKAIIDKAELFDN